MGSGETSRSQPAVGGVGAKEPLYGQIARILREEILSGVYPVGSQLPTEDKLRERFSASRHTVREAVRLLREGKLVVSRKKAGTVVTPPAAADPNFLHAISIDDILAFASRWTFKIDTIETTTLDAGLNAWVGGEAGRSWLTATGVAEIDGSTQPECWATYYIDLAYAAVGEVIRERSRRILPLIETMFGVTVVELVQEFTATLIPQDVSKSLDVEAGSAAICVRRMYRTRTGGLVMITVEIYPASRFRYNTTLQRSSP